MDMIYLQCDSRFNQWLLKKIDEQSVVEHTIERVKMIRGGKNRLIAGVINCPENEELIEILDKNGVDVRVTEEDDVNKRFLDIISAEESGYVVRVGGDQCLLDYELTLYIIKEMHKNKDEWFYKPSCSCVIPDVVSIDLIKKYKSGLENGKRYFEILEKMNGIKRYIMPYPMLIMFQFRANSREGFRICRQVIRNKLDIYELSENMQKSLINSSYLQKSGLLGSWILPMELGNVFYDENGDINPWWGESIIEIIRKHLNKSLSVFEWGSGNSTMFWAKYVKEVVSTEHDRQWYNKMSNMVPDNVSLNYCELEYGGEYCKAILSEDNMFDIILVDGRDRVRCIKNAVKRLKEDGVLILDNSEREEYIEGKVFLKGQGFKELEIGSMVYGLPGFKGFTALYYRDRNIFDL